MTALTSVAEAVAVLLAAAPRPGPAAENPPLAEALGRVLAAPVQAVVSAPPVDNSAVDGFAVRLGDTSLDRRLPVSQRIAAGQAAQPLQRGTAARIFTGAPIPPGADAVVMQEHAEVDGLLVQFSRLPGSGANIRARGQDFAAGASVLMPGQVLRAQDIALAAAAGARHLPVVPRPKVAFFSTGDELMDVGQPDTLQAGDGSRIFDSNRPLVHALLTGLGCEPIDLGMVPDEREATASALRRAAARADLVLTTGGASVGEADHLVQVLRDAGALRLWRLAIKPGKPFAHAMLEGRPVLCLPGNPAAVLVGMLILCRPFLLRMQGVADVAPAGIPIPAGFALGSGQRETYLRVRLSVDGRGAPRLECHPNQSSGVLTAAVWADGLARVPAGAQVAVGDPLTYLPFSALARL
ncbi:MAG: molybdopterin molybdotransferase MoeA [Pseudomonadota bacterium]|nr:molybdopterin molybdotransferase MoeA [Pseudomonadota bacterium]